MLGDSRQPTVAEGTPYAASVRLAWLAAISASDLTSSVAWFELKAQVR
jgi:hypothetical protein